mmetsp:Transcript_30097/g.54744  ORF Transcript_30097/g.54744 Transcript_30097/m.54744 type:complete len:263 (+) Transcript_30097:6986-7774(+)
MGLAPQQQDQQAELLGCELQALTCPGRLAAHRVDLEIGHLHDQRFRVIPVHASPTQEHLDARDQLREGKWLDQVVVRPTLQAAHPILDLAARGQHEDRNRPRMTQSREDRQPIDARKHPIQDDKVVLVHGRHVESVDAGVSYLDLVALLGQSFAQVSGRLDFVFDDQDFHEALRPCGRPPCQRLRSAKHRPCGRCAAQCGSAFMQAPPDPAWRAAQARLPRHPCGGRCDTAPAAPTRSVPSKTRCRRSRPWPTDAAPRRPCR